VNTEISLIILIAVLAVLIFAVPVIVGGFIRYRGTRVITCPETLKPAAVEVDAMHVALTAIEGEPHLRLKSCTRWPERQDCDQRCLLQVELAPEECLVRTMLDEWYSGKRCVACGHEFHHISWADHKPALLSPEGKVLDWREIHPETLPDLFVTHKPMCWDCAVLSEVAAAHPEILVDRSSISPPVVRQ
jgi:hypothetical protein